MTNIKTKKNYNNKNNISNKDSNFVEIVLEEVALKSRAKYFKIKIKIKRNNNCQRYRHSKLLVMKKLQTLTNNFYKNNKSR